jgi:FlaG protein
MKGDLSIAPPPVAVDLAPGVRPAPAGPPRPAAGPGGYTSPLDLAAALAPTEAEHAEAARLRRLLTDSAMRVSTHHDEASGHVVLRVQSRSTGEVVEQIPSDKLLQLYASLRASLVDERV